MLLNGVSGPAVFNYMFDMANSDCSLREDGEDTFFHLPLKSHYTRHPNML
jgi:hypothetical protein